MSDDLQADPYDTLGLLPGASPALVRAAFKVQAAVHHPDHNAGSADSHEMMLKLTAARDALADPDLRSRYDRSLREQSSAPRTMAEARRLLADQQSTIHTLERAVDAERRRQSHELQAELDAQKARILSELEAQLPQAEEILRQRALAQLRIQIAQELADRENMIDVLRSELAAAHSIPRVVLRAPVPDRHGPARWALVIVLSLAALVAVVALGLSCHQIAVSAAIAAPDAASWPDWLRQPTVVALVPYVTSIVLLGFSVASLERERIWLIIGPVVALACVAVIRSSAVGHLWSELPGQLAAWLGWYLAVYLLAWVLWIAVPRPARTRFR
nr:DnaJ domain-containing protein [Propionicimonas sp.]